MLVNRNIFEWIVYQFECVIGVVQYPVFMCYEASISTQKVHLQFFRKPTFEMAIYKHYNISRYEILWFDI